VVTKPEKREPIRVLIADDQVLFAESLSYVLRGISETIRIVGIATDGEAARRMAMGLRPDIVLMDVRMPKLDGVAATRLIHEADPTIRIVMLTTFDDDEYVHSAIAYGAVGYLLKNIRPEALVTSLHAVMDGATLFNREITARIVAGMADEEVVETIIAGLSPREVEVLRLARKMMSNSQIAQMLHLTDHSVRNYMSALYHAFEVKNRYELIQKTESVSHLC
jgi:DNA-binding NarL/FixJ family response regulator